MKESTKGLWRVNAGSGWKRPYLFAHAYFYLARTDLYVRLLLPTANFILRYCPDAVGRLLLSFIVPNYHSKILVTSEAKKVVSLDKDLRIDSSISERVIPFDTIKKLILEHPDSITTCDCACRMHVKKTTGTCCSSPHYGIQGCMAIGDPQALFLFEHSTLNPKRITAEQAMAQLEEFHKMGWVHTFWFKDALGERSYAMCNCCKCCCQGMLANNKLAPMIGYKKEMINGSGYIAKIDLEKCKGCLTCTKWCPFEARKLSTSNGKSELIYEKCHGCGVCIDKCPNGALYLEVDPNSKSLPPINFDNLKKEQAQLDSRR